MNVKDAVVLHLQEICAENNITYNDLANRSGITPSTIYSMMDQSRRDISIITIKKICDGLEITLSDFFDSKIFDKLEPELR